MHKGAFRGAVLTLFVGGWVLTLWDLYETILDTGGIVARLHHGYIGLFFVALAWALREGFQRLKP